MKKKIILTGRFRAITTDGLKQRIVRPFGKGGYRLDMKKKALIELVKRQTKGIK